MPDEWMTVADVAAELKINKETVKRWLRDGALGGFILSDRSGWRVERSELARFIETQKPRRSSVLTDDGKGNP